MCMYIDHDKLTTLSSHSLSCPQRTILNQTTHHHLIDTSAAKGPDSTAVENTFIDNLCPPTSASTPKAVEKSTNPTLGLHLDPQQLPTTPAQPLFTSESHSASVESLSPKDPPPTICTNSEESQSSITETPSTNVESANIATTQTPNVTVNPSTELPTAPLHKVVESSTMDTEQPSASLPSCKEEEKVSDITEQLLLSSKQVC